MTEKEGLGRFLYETMGWDITTARLASQLAALFVEAGIWHWNGRRRGMRFNSVTDNWQEALRHQYKRRLNEID